MVRSKSYYWGSDLEFSISLLIGELFRAFPNLPKSQGSYPPVNKHSNGKSPSWIGNTSSNGGFSIAMLDYRRLPRRSFHLLRIGKPWWTVRVLFTIRALWGHDMGASDLCMDKRGSSLWVFRVFSKGEKISSNNGYMTLQVVFNDTFEFGMNSSLDMI